jgi:hypothetical protein
MTTGKIKLFFLLLLISLVITPHNVLADSSSNTTNTTTSTWALVPFVGNLTDAVSSRIVAGGMNMFFFDLADDMLSLAGVTIDSTSAGRSAVPKLAYMMITINDDPFSYDWVKYWQNIMAVIYVVGMIWFVVFFGGLMVLARKMGGQAHRTLNFLLADTVADRDFENWFHRMFFGIVYGLFATIGIWLILQFNQLLANILASVAVTPVPFSGNNLVAYIIMVLGYLFIAVFMWIRSVAIDMFAAGGLGVAVLYLIPKTEGIAKWVFWRMMVLIFMQPVLIFEAAIGLTVIQHSLYAGIGIAYIGLMIILAWTAYKMTLGDFADKVSATASKVANSAVLLL